MAIILRPDISASPSALSTRFFLTKPRAGSLWNDPCGTISVERPLWNAFILRDSGANFHPPLQFLGQEPGIVS
jgi:hypothetical protein